MNIRIGNSPYSWDAIEDNSGLQNFGYQGVLDEMKASGYEGTDLGDWGFLPIEPLKLQDELQARKLELISACVIIKFADHKAWDTGLSTTLQTASLLSAVSGNQAVVVLANEYGTNPVRTRNAGRIKPEMGLLPIQWKTFIAGVEYISKRVFEETGLHSVFHHHCACSVETPGEIGMFLDYADPEWVNLCLDTGHFQFAGGDPVRIFKNFSDRVKLVHFKDCSPSVAELSRSQGWDYHQSVRNGIFCELGQGNVDFRAVKNCLLEIGYDGWIVVEQDILPGIGTPFEVALRNREYLHSINL